MAGNSISFANLFFFAQFYFKILARSLGSLKPSWQVQTMYLLRCRNSKIQYRWLVRVSKRARRHRHYVTAALHRWATWPVLDIILQAALSKITSVIKIEIFFATCVYRRFITNVNRDFSWKFWCRDPPRRHKVGLTNHVWHLSADVKSMEEI